MAFLQSKSHRIREIPYTVNANFKPFKAVIVTAVNKG